MPFELLTPTPALLTSFTSRVEKHGEDEVPAASLGFKIMAANTILDLLSSTLRTTLYTKPEGQVDLPGVEETTPLLRTRGIELLTLAGTLEGWTLTVDHGIDEEDPITCGGCKVDNFRLVPKEGGTVELLFRVGFADIAPEDAGLLWAKNHQEVQITLTAPVKSEGVVIDGTVGHPALAGQQDLDLDGKPKANDCWPFHRPDGQSDDEPQDATGAFLEAHASDAGGGQE